MLHISSLKHSNKLLMLVLLLGLVDIVQANPGKNFSRLSILTGTEDVNQNDFASDLSVSPSSLSFTAIQNRPSATQNFAVTVSNVSATTQTFIKIPPLYEVPGTTGSIGATIILTG